MSYSSPYLSTNPPNPTPPTALSPPPAPQTAPPSLLPRRGYFTSSPQEAPRSTSPPHPTFHPPPNSLFTRLPTTSTPTPHGPEWHAARQSVLSQMVTSQDFTSPATSTPIPTPVAPVTPVAPSTRGKPARRARGGRTAKIKLEETDSPPGLTPDFSTSAASGRGRGRTNRGGRPRGRGSRGGRGGGVTGKRKRKTEDEDEGGSDDSEVYAPLPTQSRSGRRITQVQTPAAVIDLDPVHTTAAGKTTQKGGMKKVKRNYRRPGEAAVCKNCGRGHSPASNRIVFCDGCNTPWHQYCHFEAPIPAEVVEIETMEWLCGDCEILRGEKGVWEGRIGVQGRMGLSERRRYLRGLGKEGLVGLVLQATVLYPGLPIFGGGAGIKEGAGDGKVDGRADGKADGGGGGVDGGRGAGVGGGNGIGEAISAEEELSDLLAERELLPYPKAGQGVRLPVELDQLAWVVDEDVGVYSHRCGWTEGDLFGGGVGVGA